MKFEDFVRRGMAKRKSIDKNLINSIMKAVESDLRFLERNEIDEVSARKMVAGYYDVLRELLEGFVALGGYKIYSHEAFVYFLGENGEKLMSEKFDRFRLIRNRINYYGKSVSCDEANEYCLEIKKMINHFIGEIKNEI